MYRSNIFFPIAALSLIISCNDKEVQPSISYPSMYYKSGLEPGRGFRVYTKDGEVKDKLTLEKFLAIDSTYFNNMNYNLRTHSYYMDSVKFSRPHQATLFRSNSEIDCTTSNSGGLIVLTQNVTIDQCCSYPEVITRTFGYYILQVKPNVFSESIYSSTRGAYLFTYVFQPKSILMKYNGKLVAPVIEYVRHSEVYYDRAMLNNILLPDFYKYLAEGDTLTLTNSFFTFELKK
jgi:hypothetical protein